MSLSTGGFHLLGLLRSHPRIILIDATRDGAPVGTVAQFRARLASDFPPALGAHDIGLRDLIAAAIFLAVWAPWFAWRWHYYGYKFPTTYYVKADGPWVDPKMAAQMAA